MVSVGRAGAVASLTTYVPFGDGVVVDVVSNGGATVTERSRGPCGVVARRIGIKLRPPVCVVRDVIGPPHFVHHVPLSRQRNVVVDNLLVVALLIPASA